ncbi:SDR family oxidoreductase [Corynebacterium terpenotabidum]|uniref:Short-chain alcohol dehydrogenase-like dehydrogenase n=1 Tax=Corynebacterium terpenotabidum Y-11 TaxID=1200352 RepID=S4XBK2_9CORY|nr:SDR family oxidoreductase [Corynebacterium terpenotabidum]AGP29951.1 short-chain alcohol dehydrogenase-like dehydrogenase [Corynebacterium terpenotabidum Y-11]
MTKAHRAHPFSRFITPTLPTVGPGDVALVTGATSGIGHATATALARAGFRVIGTSRDPASLHATANAPEGVTLIPLDLGDPASIDRLPAELATVGVGTATGSGQAPVSVLINNAGESQNGPLEELPRDALTRLFQVNVIGHVEVTQKILPGMRDQGRGRIVFVGSMLGSFPLAHRGSYGASKAAVKAFAFSARRELRNFGVGVCVMEPGAIDTGISQRRTVYIDRSGPYVEEFDTMLKNLNDNEKNGISADRVAASIMEAVTSPRPKPLYAAGSSAGLAFPAARLLPRDAMHGLIAHRHGI